MKLIVEDRTYQRRLKLMAEMIAMKAPAILIHKQALLILACHEYAGLNDPYPNSTREAQYGGGLANGVEPTSLASEESK
jgi:hypothetical protein